MIPPNINAQQPFAFSDRAPMFSPGLPTSIAQGMHPPPFLNSGLPTPMQPGFFPHPPPAQGRPPMHRGSPSMAHLAAAAMLPPGMPMTPVGQPGFPNAMLGVPPFQSFVPRPKRSPSISVGGPPKAVLGGPQRKVSPLPVNAAATPQPPAGKARKVVVNFPRETIPGETPEDPPARQSWARAPIPLSDVPLQPTLPPPEVTTAQLYPPDGWRYHLPGTVDVFLPGKSAWNELKQKIIEEKLEKLGVERGTGSSVPHIHAPHARAASISSPADPALLLFKLNKLQQSQSMSPSASTSPHPPVPMSASPSLLPPRFQGQRRGHSMSLAQTSSYSSQSPVYNPTAAFNPFGPSATLGSDQIFTRLSPAPMDNILAPQGRVPANFASLAPPQPVSRPESRPDFMRGFGLDTTEEEEEPEEDAPARIGIHMDVANSEAVSEVGEADATVDEADEAEQDGGSTVAAHSTMHSRHTSRVSAALSLRSVGGLTEGPSSAFPRTSSPSRELGAGRLPGSFGEVDDQDVDAVGEWTGSEDLRTGDETSEDESIGEWSNPSDEERARHERHQRRLLRRAKQQAQPDLETPRRLPNFPRPPDIAPSFVDQDDIVSNPSEEGNTQEQQFTVADQRGHFARPSSDGHGRPLPPLPEARPGSAPYSHHDPALAHSREASEHYLQPGGLHPRPPQQSTVRGDLNPLAKPFVFGTTSQSQSSAWSPNVVAQPALPTSSAQTASHMRVPSFGKPLNAAAQEFKPGAFTFQPPPGVPQLAFASPAASRPLPIPPDALTASPRTTQGRETQGREKRQRRGSSATLDGEDEDGVNHLATFKFPPENVKAVSAPVSPPTNDLSKDTSLDAAPRTFTFGHASTAPSFSPETAAAAESDDENMPPILTASPEPEPEEPGSAQELPFPPAMKPKRAPVPLDFKHPVSKNTVPAGLFKALNNTDSDNRTRRTVRSRLSSRDVFEHSSRPSLDDLNVPPISRRMPRNRMFTIPNPRESSPVRAEFTPNRRGRRSSLPPRRLSDDFSSQSDISLDAIDLSRRIEMEQYEDRIEEILEDKFAEIRRALSDFRAVSGRQSLSPDTEAKINEVVALFRAQLQASTSRDLLGDQVDARGEPNLEVIKDIIEQKQSEMRALIKEDLAQLASVRGQDSNSNVLRVAEDIANRAVQAVVASTSQLALRLQAIENTRSPADREVIIQDITKALMPQLAALRPAPIDHESLTARLAEAVKPHITQLIDLASDKRETAGLIVDKLVPILPSLQGPAREFDTEAIVGRLISEVRKIVAPLDAHEIKEQVSDLVVERLDSRLAVRDRAFNAEALADKFSETVRSVVAPLQELQAAVAGLGRQDHDTAVPGLDISAIGEEIHGVLSDLPDRLAAATDALGIAQAELKNRTDLQDVPLAKSVTNIESVMLEVAREQQRLVSQGQEFSDFCHSIIKHIDSLPEALVEATRILQDSHTHFNARDTSQKDAEEIRRLLATNTELQVQLAKARGAHGQVRVEKDMLTERLKAAEMERDRLFSRVDDLQEAVSTKSRGAAAAEAKSIELEEALSRALERLKVADVQTQSDSRHIAQLESLNHDLMLEKQQLKAQVDSLDIQVSFITRERDHATEELAQQRKQNQDLVNQQAYVEELRKTSDEIQELTKNLGRVDAAELEELRKIRERSKVLESENTALQRRVKEYETKMAANDKITQVAKQSLAQVQQRAAEWEKHAKEYEAELAATQTKLDNAEQAQVQLDADLTLVKLQLEERDAEERLDRDRQNKLRDQIASLEAQVARLQVETDQAKKVAAQAAGYQNGRTRNHAPSVRPASRISSNYDDSRATTPNAPMDSSRSSSMLDRTSVLYNGSRVTTPTAELNGKGSSSVRTGTSTFYDGASAIPQLNGAQSPSMRSATSPQSSVWNSIHAPRPLGVTPTSTFKQASSYHRSQAPSPAPSNVSAAPTLREDGWWE
ncbi:hypothetical protein WOLCODRAFT_134939 [Wolfiporia cocos MD-104 SS10]|uniref:Uncharacterized protein n=1 Tax=Wolfiporia cocos (strain MD-104) TaxID=742152 RepID=A0A2H3J015_WOLCO|nr:hypothetical protein WOLCODRAFT_134939 [Wolfiporia cocos MD-104 SS10]